MTKHLNMNHSYRLQRELRRHLDITLWENPFAVTLTFKKAYHGPEGRVWITLNHCEKNLVYFLRVLERRVYSKRARKNGARLNAIWAFERDTSGRYHCHL